MGVRIQELPETTGINKEDVLIVEDGQGTKKGTVQQLDEALGVSQLKEDLVDNGEKILDINGKAFFTKGYYINTNQVENSKIDINPIKLDGYAYTIVDVKNCYYVNITGTGGNSPRLYAFTDSNYNLIEKSKDKATYDGILIIPDNAKYLIVNVDLNEQYNLTISKSEISSAIKYSGIERIAFQKGYFIPTGETQVGSVLNITKTDSNDYYYSIYDVTNVSKLCLNGEGGNSPRLYTFIDGNNIVLAKAFIDTVADNLVVDVPNNSAKVIINSSVQPNCYARTIYSDYSASVNRNQYNDTVIVASVNSTAYEKEIANFVCDGENDEVEISKAINSLTNGGTVKFCSGTYELDSFVNQEYGLHYCISVDFTGKDRTIKLEGLVNNRWYTARNGVTFHVNTNKFDDSEYSVIGCMSQKENKGEGFDNYMKGSADIVMNNITISLQSSDKKVIGIDLRHFGSAYLEHVVVETDSSVDERFKHLQITVPNEYMVGIYGMQTSQQGQRFVDVIVNSFYYGILIKGSDHTVMENVSVCRCVYGYYFDTLYKTCTVINCDDEGNTYLPQFVGQGSISMIDFNIERYKDTSPVITSATERRSKDTDKWGGTITYRMNRTISEWNPTGSLFFAEGFGKNFNCRNTDNPLRGPSQTNITNPEYLERFFNTTENKFYTWNGTNWVVN